MPSSSDMLRDDVQPLILRLALPSMAAMIASSLCTLTDSLLLSRLGARASSAASVGFPIITLIQTVGFTLGMGSGSLISRSMGGAKARDAYPAAVSALMTALGISLPLCAVCFVFARPFVLLLGAPADAQTEAALYARFVLACGPLLCVNLVLSSQLRALGQALASMAAYVLGAITGVALQSLLIPRMGVAGSGVAMLAREALSFAILLLYAQRCTADIRPSGRLRAFSVRALPSILRFGLPTLVRQGFMSVSSMLLSRVSASLGSAALSGMGIAVRASALISSAVIGFGQGFTPALCCALGAGDHVRAGKAYRFSMRCIVFSLLALGPVAFFLAAPLLSPFCADEAAAVFAQKALRAESIVLFAQGAVILMNMLVQAMGLPVRASLIAASRQGYVLIALLLVLPRLFGECGLLLARPVSDVLSLILCLLLTHPCLKGPPVTRSSYGPYGYSGARKASR